MTGRRLPWDILLALILGLALGLAYAWMIAPVQVIDSAPEALRAELIARWEAEQPEDAPLDSSTRLFLATVGAVLVMVLLIGIGAVILGLLSFRRGSDSVTPPPTIAT